MGGANAGLAPPPEQVESADSTPSESMQSEQQVTTGEETRMEEGDITETSKGGTGEESEREETNITVGEEDTARKTEGEGESETGGASDTGEREDSKREDVGETTGEQSETMPSEKEHTPSPAVDEASLAPGGGEEQATEQVADEREGEMETD